ncbi:hypothetical protein [Reichenbachiella sp. 5M10]|uniref:hypothetical protein n=1 Tax=Reichenbachiella sp. 5M10 TaxID=1889772 RepID=UPI00130433BB|nr:hypothetical protein [Reichenbachiella sp. 5M10]
MRRRAKTRAVSGGMAAEWKVVTEGTKCSEAAMPTGETAVRKKAVQAQGMTGGKATL